MGLLTMSFFCLRGGGLKNKPAVITVLECDHFVSRWSVVLIQALPSQPASISRTVFQTASRRVILFREFVFIFDLRDSLT